MNTFMPTAPPISTFIRPNSTVKDLLVFLYQLCPLDVDVLFILLKNSNNNRKGQRLMSLEEIAKEAHREKSTVFRSLQKLVSIGLCGKETVTGKEKGYHHIYSVLDSKVFKKEVEKEAQLRVEQIQASISRILRTYDEDLSKVIVKHLSRTS
jgi:predicted transcriptional regulator